MFRSRILCLLLDIILAFNYFHFNFSLQFEILILLCFTYGTLVFAFMLVEEKNLTGEAELPQLGQYQTSSDAELRGILQVLHMYST